MGNRLKNFLMNKKYINLKINMVRIVLYFNLGACLFKLLVCVLGILGYKVIQVYIKF